MLVVSLATSVVFVVCMWLLFLGKSVLLITATGELETGLGML